MLSRLVSALIPWVEINNMKDSLLEAEGSAF